MNFALIDPYKILGYGVSGLGFLLALLAYFLLRHEQRTSEPRPPILRAVNRFMVFAAALAVLGISSEVIHTRYGPAPVSAATSVLPVPCSEIAGWPKGRWYVWGHLDSRPTQQNTDNWNKIPQVTSEAVFISNTDYEAQTEQPTTDERKNTFKATFKAQDKPTPLVPGGTVNFEGANGTGYKNEGTLTATADGCMIDGDFRDNVGNRGHLHYLYKSGTYFVLPK